MLRQIQKPPYQIMSKEQETPQDHIDTSVMAIETYKLALEVIEMQIDDRIRYESENGITDPDKLRSLISQRSYLKFLIDDHKTVIARCQEYLPKEGKK